MCGESTAQPHVRHTCGPVRHPCLWSNPWYLIRKVARCLLYFTTTPSDTVILYHSLGFVESNQLFTLRPVKSGNPDPTRHLLTPVLILQSKFLVGFALLWDIKICYFLRHTCQSRMTDWCGNRFCFKKWNILHVVQHHLVTTHMSITDDRHVCKGTRYRRKEDEYISNKSPDVWTGLKLVTEVTRRLPRTR